MLRCRQCVPPLYVRLSFQTSQDEERLDGWGKGQVGLKERNGKGINIPFSISHSPHPSHPTFACILCLKNICKGLRRDVRKGERVGVDLRDPDP